MQILSKDFWAGVNVGSVTIFVAWLVLGKFAMLLMAAYVFALLWRWWQSRQASPHAEFVVQADFDDDIEDGGFDTLDGLMTDDAAFTPLTGTMNELPDPDTKLYKD